jgi:uncharacterized protein (TIGR04255 family)
MLRQYSNRHLVEVNCGFQFQNESTLWDSTFFGQFYEKIKSDGFNEKQERKGVQIKFEPNSKGNTSLPFTSSEVEDQVIFKNTDKGWAIAMGKNRISFHVLKNYTNWLDFASNVIQPYSQHYRALGLGNGIRTCNIIYLNQFIKPVGEQLSDYFNIISPINSSYGIETITSLQRIVESNVNLLITKLNSQAVANRLNINLECGAVCKNIACMNNSDWIEQANQTHGPVRGFFESIITEKLRAELI